MSSSFYNVNSLVTGTVLGSSAASPSLLAEGLEDSKSKIDPS